MILNMLLIPISSSASALTFFYVLQNNQIYDWPSLISGGIAL